MPSYFHSLGFENSVARMKSERHYSGRLTSALRGSDCVNPGAVTRVTTLHGHIRLRGLSSSYYSVPWRVEKQDTVRGWGLLGKQHSRILQLFDLSTPSHSALTSLYCEAYQMCSPLVPFLSPLLLFSPEN